MAVRLRVIAMVFAITALVVIVSILLTYAFGNRVLEAHAREQLRRDGITRLEQLESIVKDAETGQRGFIITGDESYLRPFNEASERLPGELEKLQGFPWIDINPDEIGRIGQLIQQEMGELRSTIEKRRSGGFAAVVPIIRAGSGKELMDNLRAEVARLKERQLSALGADAKMSDRTTRTRTLVFLFSGVLNIAMFGWAYRRITEIFQQRDVALRESSRRGFELQQQKDLLNVTLTSIGDCVMVSDKEGQITFMNPVAEQVTGWKFEEAQNRPTTEVFRILNEHTRQPVESPVEKVMKHGVIVGLANHTLLIRKDGSEVPIDDSGAPIRDINGDVRGVVLVFRDFSEHKRAERELLEAKEAAETASKVKDQFLAMLSHELRTPLTPVLATINLWEASEEVPPSLHPDLQMLRRSIELEARIIDDLLDLTRIARGMLSFSPENTDVHVLIEFLVDLSQSEVQNKQLSLSLQLKAAQPHVPTDASRLQQVLWNIIRNAVKFTDARGEIVVTTSNGANGNIDISVTDNGIGMTAETISKLFVPFEQADPTRNRHYGGLGLGMAISNALVELLEGELHAKSEGLGRGSTFTLSFPTTREKAPSSETNRVPVTSRSKVRLLLIEDHSDTARALVRLLENGGYNSERVPNVALGLEATSRGDFDLLL